MIDIDLRNLASERIGPDRGVELEAELDALGPILDGDVEALLARRGDAREMLGWIDLPTGQQEVLNAIEGYAAWVSDRFDDLVVLGIGGSSLGASAVLSALQHPARALQEIGRAHV